MALTKQAVAREAKPFKLRDITEVELLADFVAHVKPTEQPQLPANPKQAFGAAKLPLAMAPESAVAYMSIGMYEGQLKYGYVNFRAAPVEAMTYINALKRHIGRWTEGEWADEQTQVPHLASALSCIAIIVDAHTHGSLIDNRPFSNVGYGDIAAKLTPIMRNLEALHGDKKPRHYTIADNGKF